MSRWLGGTYDASSVVIIGCHILFIMFKNNNLYTFNYDNPHIMHMQKAHAVLVSSLDSEEVCDAIHSARTDNGDGMCVGI